MEKKWQITITEKGDKINFEFERTKFSATEMLGLLELLRDNIICLMKSKQRPEVDTLNAFRNAMKSEQHPEVEYKAKDVENDICRECDNGNWLANLCWKGHSRCDGQKCIDFEKDEEL